MKRLYRSENDVIISGLCGGIGEVYSVDPSLVRILALLAVLSTFPIGLLVYLIAAAIVPRKSEI